MRLQAIALLVAVLAIPPAAYAVDAERGGGAAIPPSGGARAPDPTAPDPTEPTAPLGVHRVGGGRDGKYSNEQGYGLEPHLQAVSPAQSRFLRVQTPTQSAYPHNPGSHACPHISRVR